MRRPGRPAPPEPWQSRRLPRGKRFAGNAIRPPEADAGAGDVGIDVAAPSRLHVGERRDKISDPGGSHCWCEGRLGDDARIISHPDQGRLRTARRHHMAHFKRPWIRHPAIANSIYFVRRCLIGRRGRLGQVVGADRTQALVRAQTECCRLRQQLALATQTRLKHRHPPPFSNLLDLDR